MTQRSPLVALLVGIVAGAGIAACASKSPGAAAPGAMGGLDDRATGRDPEIERLDAQISRDLDTMGVDRPSQAELTELRAGGDALPMPMGVEASTTCEAPPDASACSDVCTLATSICGNARRICELAAELDGDDWAAERCTSGKASCQRATARCCDC